MFFQSKSRGSQSSSSLRRGNPNSSSSQKKNTADKSDDDIDPEQFARILELLTNPKLKNILRPEIADALEDNLSVLQKTDSFEAQRCVLNQRFCLTEHSMARANLNKSKKSWLLLPQHQSTYPRGQESASIDISPFRPKFTYWKYL